MTSTDEDPIYKIQTKLEQYRENYTDRDGVELLVGGLYSYIYPEKYKAIAEKHNYKKYKSYNLSDTQVLYDVKRFIENNTMTVVAAFTEDKRIDVWTEPNR
jgi:hypothetical protein